MKIRQIARTLFTYIHFSLLLTIVLLFSLLSLSSHAQLYDCSQPGPCSMMVTNESGSTIYADSYYGPTPLNRPFTGETFWYDIMPIFDSEIDPYYWPNSDWGSCDEDGAIWSTTPSAGRTLQPWGDVYADITYQYAGSWTVNAQHLGWTCTNGNCGSSVDGCSAQMGANLYSVSISNPAENAVFLIGQEVCFESVVTPTPPSATYSWSYIQGSGSPSMGSGSTFTTTLNSEGEIIVQLTVSINGIPDITTTRKIKVTKPTVTEVSFANDYPLKDWPSGSSIADPVWVQNTGKNEPVAYRMSSTAVAQVKLESSLNLTNPVEIQVFASGTQESINSINVYVQNFPTTTSGMTSTTLNNRVDVYTPLDLTWKYKVKKLDGTTYGSELSMNGTSHYLYLTYDAPSVQFYDFGIDKAVSYARYYSDISQIASVINTGIDYYIGYDPSAASVSHPLEVYNTGLAVCEDNAKLLSCLAKHLGISATPMWIFGGHNITTGCIYRYGTEDKDATFRVDYSAHDFAPAHPHYKYHTQTFINNIYYDPSYGGNGLLTLDETATDATRQVTSSSGYANIHDTQEHCECSY